MTSNNPRLWQLSEIISELETAIVAIQEDETLTDSEREAKLEQAFTQWLQTGESFKVKAEQVAAYIRHQESLAEARKAEAKRIRTLAEQAENTATRLRHYLTLQMQKAGKPKIEGVIAKIYLRKNPPILRLNVPPEELPHHLVRVEYSPRKDLIKQELKTNPNSYKWAYFITDETMSVIIK